MKRRYYKQHNFVSQKEQPFFSEKAYSIQSKKEKVPFFQIKNSEELTVGRPGDKYEQEADAMANAVMSNSVQSATVQRKGITGIQRKCDQCAEEEKLQSKLQLQEMDEEPEVQTQKEEEEDIQKQEEEEETPVQTKANGQPEASQNLPDRISKSSGNGQKLSPKTKKKMESAFGTDFSNVSIHTSSDAIQMNKELHAQAFTHGNDIFFNSGKYQPESAKGQHLLAHELTHVVQQNTGIKRKHIQPKLVYGSNYKGYSSDVAEVGKAKSNSWNPTTIDFKANASRSGSGTGAKNLDGLIKIIKKAPENSIKRLDIIGHSNSHALGLGGDVHTQGVPLTGIISKGTLQGNKAKIDAIKDRFASDAVITLYSCNSGGTSGGLLDAVSAAFGICAKGFSNSVWWCIIWKNKSSKIISRGNVFYADPNDPLAGITHPDCTTFNKSVHDLTPDITSCKGKKEKEKKACIKPDSLSPLFAFNQLATFNFSEPSNTDAQLPQNTIHLTGLKLGDGLDAGTHASMRRVMELQQNLNKHGASLQEDGKFGNYTLNYLNQLQRRMGLNTTDRVDPITATVVGLDPSLLGKTSAISQIEGLKEGDGLIWGTWHLRPRVKKLQTLLTLHKFPTEVDGMFGHKTKTALNAFQQSNDITSSNSVDGKTADLLEGRESKICPFGEIPVFIA